MSFSEDLKRGKEAENRLIELGKKLGYQAVPIDGKFAGYDFFIAETKKAYEVKYDPMSQKTGNVVVEIEMYGRPSGLMTTIADYWIFDLVDVILTIQPQDLMCCIIQTQPPLAEFVGPGDDSPKKAYLIKKEVLKRFANKITKAA